MGGGARPADACEPFELGDGRPGRAGGAAGAVRAATDEPAELAGAELRPAGTAGLAGARPGAGRTGRRRWPPGSGRDDEPLLEELLDDRARAVRVAAAALLDRLPDSRPGRPPRRPARRPRRAAGRRAPARRGRPARRRRTRAGPRPAAVTPRASGARRPWPASWAWAARRWAGGRRCCGGSWRRRRWPRGRRAVLDRCPAVAAARRPPRAASSAWPPPSSPRPTGAVGRRPFARLPLPALVPLVRRRRAEAALRDRAGAGRRRRAGRGAWCGGGHGPIRGRAAFSATRRGPDSAGRGAPRRGALAGPAGRAARHRRARPVEAWISDSVGDEPGRCAARSASCTRPWPCATRSARSSRHDHRRRRPARCSARALSDGRHALRRHAEDAYAAELAALAAGDDRPRPPGWRLSPWAVTTYLLGGTAADGTVITPKYVGQRRLIEVAVATLATDRALLLLGVPGTAKTWVGEHLAAAVVGPLDAARAGHGGHGRGEHPLRVELRPPAGRGPVARRRRAAAR